MDSRLFRALHLLNTAYLINKKVKRDAYEYVDCECCRGSGCSVCRDSGYYISVDYELRDRMYGDKTKLIRTILSEIKRYSLPIRFGKTEGVIYFEYRNTQCSFHDPFNRVTIHKRYGKLRWTGKPNKRLPFGFIYTIN